MIKRLRIIAGTFVLASIAASGAMGQGVSNNVLDSILNSYQSATSTWQGPIISLASNLFFLLAGIELIWTGIRLALNGADIQVWAGELIQRIMFIGLFLFLLLNAGFANDIVTSFRQAANISAGVGAAITPSNVFDMGINLATMITQNVTISDIAGSVGLIITGLIMTIAFALMAAFLLLAIVEMYILINAGVILLGFGGSMFTKDIALRFLTYTVSVGAKLFVMQLVIGLGMSLLFTQVQGFTPNGVSGQALVMLGVAITFLALVWSLPDMVQSIINGVAYGGSGGIVRAAAGTIAGGAVAARIIGGAGRATFGAGHAVSEAAKLATAQGNPGVAGTAAALGNTLRGVVADRMTGTPGSQFGSTAGRTVESLRNQRVALANTAGSASSTQQSYISPAGGQAGGNKTP